MSNLPTRTRNAMMLCPLLAWALVTAAKPAAQAPVDEPIRTADVDVRGLTRADFPRVHQLAENVYVYAGLQTRTDIEMKFPTNNLIVVTSEGCSSPTPRSTKATPGSSSRPSEG